MGGCDIDLHDETLLNKTPINFDAIPDGLCEDARQTMIVNASLSQRTQHHKNKQELTRMSLRKDTRRGSGPVSVSVPG